MDEMDEIDYSGPRCLDKNALSFCPSCPFRPSRPFRPFLKKIFYTLEQHY
ncbi:MAG: hypothetical protein K940chlam3_00612 [Chlamydiae bacterium]|nr:hypothetical protein [Chlamydiota bacterium]